jgi:exopolyphosphatase/guanosine-5'-triphosphate,3'-diphosphate pyrophosphatase
MSSRPGPNRDVAVVDVGSNSVRLVLYRLEGRAIWPVFNEKVLAGLGRDLPRTGRLSPEGVAAALGALRRFRVVLEGAPPDQLFVTGTAAVREASDGPAFVERVWAETGLNIRVLSGAEEARYSALGVVAGEGQPTGVVGDLGGSSLELIRLEKGDPSVGVTLPLGPFALGAPKDLDEAAVRRACAAALDPVASRFEAEEFHAVGGAWRNIAMLHMAMTDYPLRVVQQYQMTGEEAHAAAALIARQSRASLARIEGMSKKRLETLPYSAVVLEALIERLSIRRVVVSAFGLREGMIFDGLPPDLAAEDPLISSCEAMGARFGVAEGMGAALYSWMEDSWRGLEPAMGGREMLLTRAACELADMGARLHPDHRAELAFNQVLRAPVPGQSHAERAFLATAIHARYTSRESPEALAAVARLLTPERIRRARALGAAMRLAADLGARRPELLARSRLTLSRDAAMLTVDPGSADLLLGEQTLKRLETLARTLDLEPKVRKGG